jgi:hypothetical protein
VFTLFFFLSTWAKWGGGLLDLPDFHLATISGAATLRRAKLANGIANIIKNVFPSTPKAEIFNVLSIILYYHDFNEKTKKTSSIKIGNKSLYQRNSLNWIWIFRFMGPCGIFGFGVLCKPVKKMTWLPRYREDKA